MAKARVKAPAAPRGLQTREEVTEAIAEIGRAQRERAKIEAEMNDELADTKQFFEEQARPHGETIAALQQRVQDWCEAHRDELTQSGRVKTANLQSGEVQWRMCPPKVSLKAVDTVLKHLYDRGLGRFVRVKEEVNKEAILAEPEAVKGVPGITIAQAEEFVITPFEAKLEDAA